MHEQLVLTFLTCLRKDMFCAGTAYSSGISVSATRMMPYSVPSLMVAGRVREADMPRRDTRSSNKLSTIVWRPSDLHI